MSTGVLQQATFFIFKTLMDPNARKLFELTGTDVHCIFVPLGT